ncbi:MAG: M20/M25/M40 family metallo-hydrolase [Kiritimatiellae bacterium]|nr:M20/M25/M40 family metallo-hydrolase [Kiritimatiellia bacterium]
MSGFDDPKEKETILEEYFELLRFPSVGADPARLKNCVDCAMWLKKWLSPQGFAVELMQAPKMLGTPPVVFAERRGSEGAPTILFYGHYDVQPEDPLDAWETPPFEPTLKDDGRVYCRGAQDDKGQFFAFLCGMRNFLESGPETIPTIKIVLEGQEESGSAALTALAPEIKDRLRADVLLVCDTGAAAEMRPAIMAGLRGVSHINIRLDAATHDLHSGEHGGIAPNPAQGIAELVASLHNPDGSIAVRGFCDRVTPPTDEERAAAEAAAVSPEEYEKITGVAPVGGEEGFTLTERNSFRPTIEVNGIHTGYGGPGAKTVIPASAIARLSMRLVPDQIPADAMAAIERHLRQHTPRGMRLSIEERTDGAAGFRLPLASPVFRLAASVLKEMDPRGAVYQWDGASIPVVSTLKTCSGAAPLIVGFGQPEDRIHAPNESYGLHQFERAMEWARRILGALA